ncbi:MAG TPA: LacI family DNA-binding transcriptional regulator [Candidatus Limnocylindrales bacterium]
MAATRITQREVARLAGVSQTTVSLVLNNRIEAAARIPAETRDRVLQIIRETGYVADPLARSLLRRHNQILGVFTYEPVFPKGSADFYHPFLVGIEACAEGLGCDLLLFTSAPVTDGTRRIFHANNRLRLADGCVLLGREIPADELERLVAEGHPFVSVGRRDPGASGPVPYVGADYATAAAELTRSVVAHGHRRVAYVGWGGPVESSADRYRGYRSVMPDGPHLTMGGGLPAVLDALAASGVTAVVCEDPDDAVTLIEAGLDLSLVALGEATRHEITGLRIPRREMGFQAVEVLVDILHGPDGGDHQRLLPCEPVQGNTLKGSK